MLRVTGLYGTHVSDDVPAANAASGLTHQPLEAPLNPAPQLIGFGGLLVEVVPDLRLVVAVSRDIPDGSMLDTATLMTLVSAVVIPAMT